ncbi:MAG: GNAT family N-acetyltransferase [Symploca sp. SIO3E6]|nr:GNAT family N-acetyltransferase [Caldora sp. SIO3E6]
MNRPVYLLRVQDWQVVNAILTEVTQKHLNDAKILWEPQLQGTQAEDEYWDWVVKSRRAKLLPGDELYAIECDGVTQGLIIIDILKKRCQIESQLRSRLVYIRALATAPWNRPVITNPPTYKGVGGNLIDFAIARSYELGYQGKIGLHALPGALGFYRKLRVGLLDCGCDPEDPDNLNYFETLQREP